MWLGPPAARGRRATAPHWPTPSAVSTPFPVRSRASLCVAGLPHSRPNLTRAGSAVTVAVLGLRGAIGLAGRMPHARRSAVFADLDRRVYSPLCLGLALLALSGVLPDAPAD
jgi:hypothetical protein